MSDTSKISVKLMFVLEYKVNPKPQQILSIQEAIRTTQFVRNKVLRYWMDNTGLGKTELFRYNTTLRAEYPFVKDLNSHACQTAVERVLRAISRFYENCKNQVKGKKGYPKFSKNTRSVEYIAIIMLVRYAFFSPLPSGRGVGGEGDTS